MPMPRHGGHALLLLAALLASTVTGASAQPTSDGDYDQGQQVHVSTSMIALLAAVVAVFVFIAFFTVYLRHCTRSSPADYDADERAMMPNLDALISRSRRQRRPRGGLDADVVEAFPTMRYAEAKALRVVGKHEQALECAVCLSEFEDEERLRLLLPRCSHAFHPDCIGEWLACHVTCPVCRCNLEPSQKDDTSSDEERPPPAGFVLPMIPVASSVSSETAVSGPIPVAAVVIDVVTEEEEEERRQEALELQQIGTQRRAAMRSRSVPTTQLTWSHSTGHSLAVRLDQDLERFTLRLPEQVRREMGEHYSMQLRRGRRGAAGGGEGSSRGGRSAPLGRAAAAGSRWQSLLARTFSSGTGKLSSFFYSASSRMAVSSELVGEVSSSSSLSTRARGKRVAAVDAAADVPVRLDRLGVGGRSGAKAGAASGEVALADEEKKAAATQQVRT